MCVCKVRGSSLGGWRRVKGGGWRLVFKTGLKKGEIAGLANTSTDGGWKKGGDFFHMSVFLPNCSQNCQIRWLPPPPSLRQLPPPLCTFLGLTLFIVFCLPPSFSTLPSLIQRTPHSYDVSLMRSNRSKSHKTAAKHFQIPTKWRKEKGKRRDVCKKEFSWKADSSAEQKGLNKKTFERENRNTKNRIKTEN